jgi:hypothetical protein
MPKRVDLFVMHECVYVLLYYLIILVYCAKMYYKVYNEDFHNLYTLTNC